MDGINAVFGALLYATPYGIGLALGVALGIVAAVIRGERRGEKQDVAFTTALLAVPLCVVFARLVFCACRYREVLTYGWTYILHLEYGGFSMIGASIGLLFAILFTSRLEHERFLETADIVLPGALLALSIARFAEYFTGNGGGMEISLEALWFWPIAKVGFYGEYVYAVYMAEGLTALIAFFATQWRGDGHGAGYTAGLGVILVAAMQIIWESARRDDLLMAGFVRYQQVYAAIVLLVMLLINLKRTGWKTGKKSIYIVIYAVMILLCALNEFLIDGKLIPEIPVWACYLVDLICCLVVILLSEKPLRIASDRIVSRKNAERPA